jgi:plastocyanin
MRAIFALVIGIAPLLAAACGSSTSTSVAKSCGSSGAAANINTASSNIFSPSVATITHGQAVCWQNSSAVAHTVTADNGAFNTRAREVHREPRIAL